MPLGEFSKLKKGSKKKALKTRIRTGKGTVVGARVRAGTRTRTEARIRTESGTKTEVGAR